MSEQPNDNPPQTPQIENAQPSPENPPAPTPDPKLSENPQELNEKPTQKDSEKQELPQLNEPEKQPEKEPEPKELLEVDERGALQCPKHKIEASNFCLVENSPYAVNCVLCIGEHEMLQRMPQLNLSLSLVLNEKLANQLFNEKQFESEDYESKVDEMINGFKAEFENHCTSLRKAMIERLQNESHEFMLKKIRSFLDKARKDYKNNPRDADALRELCSTFNDFLLLKKSDEVVTTAQELETFKGFFDQMNRTIGVNFKYLHAKVANEVGVAGDDLRRTQSNKETFVSSQIRPRPIDNSVVVNSARPVNYSYTSPTQIRHQPQSVNVQKNGFFENVNYLIIKFGEVLFLRILIEWFCHIDLSIDLKIKILNYSDKLFKTF